ncbi:hypothetical protein DPSP01_008053 [Paraphaeosphaeria sporulosa]
MVSGKDSSAASPQHTTQQHQGERAFKFQTKGSRNMDNSVREPELRALPVQETEGNDCAMKQSPKLVQIGAAYSSPPVASDQNDIRSTSTVYSCTSSSNGGIQLHTPGPAVGADIGDASPSPATYPHISPASVSQVFSSSPLRQSLEPRYSPPSPSAVSSSSASPVTPTFSRPRHPQSGLADDPLDIATLEDAEKPAKDGSDCREHDSGRDTIDYAESDDSSEADDEESRLLYVDGNDVTNLKPPIKDDAEDVINSLIDGRDGIVVPRIDEITSIKSNEMDLLMETALDGITPPRRGASPQSVRGAPFPTGQIMSQLAAPSSIRDMAQSHVQFATSTSVQDTLFAKTLKYFKQSKDKENTPSRSRRKTLLPDDIAELAKDAQQEGIEDDKALWDEYKDLDFAPLDPVMDSQIAEDLIIGTPVRKTFASVEEYNTGIDRSQVIRILPKSREIPWGNKKKDNQASASLGLKDKIIEGHANETGPMYLVNIPGRFSDAFQLRFRSRASIGLIASFLRERGEALDASKDDIDFLVKEFLEYPIEFTTWESTEKEPLNSDSDNGVNLEDNQKIPGTGSVTYHGDDYGHSPDNHTHEKEVISQAEDPAFVKALGMAPEAMFWVVAQPIARYSNKILGATIKAFDAALQQLMGVSLDEPLTPESWSSESSESSE